MTVATEGLNTYLSEIGHHRLLTKEEERMLFKAYSEGARQVREIIIGSNLRLVIRIAREFLGRGMPLEDLIQEGNIGLIEVIDKFDYRRGFRFSTYAAFWIRQAIQQALRKNGNLIRLPVRKSRMLGQMTEVITRYLHDQGREPTTDELAREMEVPEEQMTQLLKMRESVVSLDDASEDGDCLRDSIPAQDQPSPVERLAEEERRTKVRDIMNFLSEKERRVVQLRFGFEHGQSLSLRHTSRLVGLSQEGVRRVERKALTKLRRPAIASRVIGLL